MNTSFEVSKELTRLGKLLYKDMKFGEAIFVFDTSVEINPLNTDSYRELGRLYIETGNFDLAEKTLLRSLQLDPSNLGTINSLVMLFVFMCKKKSLHKILLHSIKIEPNDPSPHLKITTMLMFSNKFNEAFAITDKVLEFDPTNYIAHCNCGVIHMKLGRIEKAISSFNLAIDNSPNYCLAWLHLSALQFHLGQLEEANKCLLEVFETVTLVVQKDFYFGHLAIKYDEKDFFVRYWNSELFFNPGLGLTILEDFKALDENFPTITFKDLTEKFLHQPQDAEWFFEMGKTAFSRGWFSLALEYFANVEGKKAIRQEFRVDLQKTTKFFVDAIEKNVKPSERKRQILNETLASSQKKRRGHTLSMLQKTSNN
ncbi:cellulose synthase operon protein c [Anaeramoeba flamelloides]|uniref:Cellulose synthase operon protein c n=1 Tax=Anaeramoeba flamelloides TaxID=1746091 RepID=A0AAV7YAG5_9EUKA|nr:cellulose synthase operon protein c [Anaeramoeba flamelloides]|eukprot:Anaeramoba_flamelloidesa1062616_42.p1 GENE.a1062616_42~~a1062616_42.p1  ORF type:complete len:370 (+),score=95.92 a1062616_42:108-1217(+)